MQKQNFKVIFNLITGFLIKFLSFILSKLGGLIFYILIINLLDKPNADLFFEANALILLLAPMASLGLIYSAIKFFPIYYLKKEYQKMLDFIYNSIIFFVVALVAVFLLLPFSLPQRLNPYFLYVFFGIAAALFAMFFNNLLISLKKFNESLFVDLSLQVSKILLFLFFAFSLIKNVTSALLAFALGYLIQSLIGLFFVFKFLSSKISLSISNLFSSKPNTIKDNISFGLPFLLNTLIEPLLAQTDILLVAYFLADQPGTVAGYALISLIVKNISPVILSPLYQSQQIILVEEKEKKTTLYDKIIFNMTRWSIYLGLVVLGFFIIFGKYFLYFIANQYQSLSYLFLFFAPFVLFDLLSASTRMALFAEGKTKLLFFISLSILILNIVLDLVLIPIYGLVGAAAATSISMFFGSLLIFYFSKKNMSFIFNKKIMFAFFVFIFSFSLTNLLLEQLYMLKLDKIFLAIGLIVLAGFFSASYFLLLLIFKGFTKQDFLIILRFLNQLPEDKFNFIKHLKHFIKLLFKYFS